jgi:pyruvate dehydrogenase E2 component (dihydrolipoamide acetyltransferase)
VPARQTSAVSLVEHGELRGLRPSHLDRTGAAAPRRAATLERAPVGARSELLSRRRLATARVLVEAAAIPQFSVARHVPLGPATAAVADLRGDGVAATLTDAIILAVARAALAQPRANAWLVDDTLYLFERVSVALAVDTPDGVLAPVVRDADQIELAAIARARADLVERARSGKLLPTEIEGGTITISNIGGLGADSIVPVVTPPQVAVLGVGRCRAGAAGAPAQFTFVGDHRALDGADGARFLAALADELQTLDDH